MVDIASTLDIPWVETLHGMFAYLNADSWESERRRAEKIALQIAVSDLVRRQYLARIAYPPERIVTVANGINFTRVGVCDRDEARAALGVGARSCSCRWPGTA